MDEIDTRAALLLFGAIVLTPSPAHALDWELAVQNRFFLQTLPERDLAQPRHSTLTSSTTALAYQLHALGSIAGRPTDRVGLRLGVDTGLIELGIDRARIDGRDPGEALERTGFLGETLLDLQLGEGGVVQIQLGKLRRSIGRGAVFDAYAFGATLDADGTLLTDPVPVSVRFGAMIPDATFTEQGKQSPLFDLELSYHFNRRAQLRWVSAFFLDNDTGVSPIFQQVLSSGRAQEIAQAGEPFLADRPEAEREAARLLLMQTQQELVGAVAAGGAGYDVTTGGWLGWSGIQADIGLKDLELSAIALVGFGALDTTITPDPAFERALRAGVAQVDGLADAVLARQRTDQEVELLSYYLAVDARYALTEDLAIEMFGIAMGGDDGIPSPIADPDPDRNFHGFVSIAPFIPKTSIFFGGGTASAHSSPTIASLAPNGGGLLAGGIDVQWFVVKEIRLRALAAAMASSVTRDAYGVELGTSIDAFLLDWLVLSADANVFIPGQHFTDLEVGYQAIAVLRVLFEG